MKIGVTFPQTEIGNDPDDIKLYGEEVESMGFSHILAYEHVVGANLENRPNWNGVYNIDDPFHEPFVLFSFLSSITSKIKFFTGVIILPQRPVVLVAKQAASLDILSNGRLELGIGIGWNDLEYDALGMNFKNRGKRCEEQIEVLKKLWTNKSVSFEGNFHKIPDVGINPMPKNPIPIWIGGGAEVVLKRTARVADGWMATIQPNDQGFETIKKFKKYIIENGRDPKIMGINGTFIPAVINKFLNTKEKSILKDEINKWKELGATQISINTMNLGLESVSEHLSVLENFSDFLN
mgnify:CR=1 FL=1